MSVHTNDYLNENVLVGFGRKAWHFRSANEASVANHFQGAVPVSAIQELFKWDAVSAPVSVTVPKLNGVSNVARELEDKQAVVHAETGHVFGIFSNGYVIAQHRDAVLGGALRVMGDGIGIESAGQVDFGGLAWVSVSLKDTVMTAEGVEFLPSILFYGSMTGKLATGAKRTSVLTVCDNTLAMSLGQRTAMRYSVKHTKNAGIRIEDAHAALGILGQIEDEFSAAVKELCEQTVTDKQWSDFVQAYVPIAPDAVKGRAVTMAETKREQLTSLWNSSPMVSQWKNTKFGVVQAVNTHFHHDSIVRGQTRMEKNLMASLTGKVEELDTLTLATLERVMQQA